MSNTDKNYPCTRCGSSHISIIREGANPRVKCNACGFTYDAIDSVNALKADAIPDSPPPEVIHEVAEEQSDLNNLPTVSKSPRLNTVKLPRTLRYLLVAKDRSEHLFCNDKDLKRKIMQWEAKDKSYELYQLTPKEVEAKVSIT